MNPTIGDDIATILRSICSMDPEPEDEFAREGEVCAVAVAEELGRRVEQQPNNVDRILLELKLEDLLPEQLATAQCCQRASTNQPQQLTNPSHKFDL